VVIKTERHDLIIITQSTKYQRFSNISTTYTPGNAVFWSYVRGRKCCSYKYFNITVPSCSFRKSRNIPQWAWGQE